MSTLASLNVMIGANSAVLRKELVRARKATGSFVKSAKKELTSLARGTAQIGRTMGTGLAAGTATLGVGIVAMERTLKSIDDIRRQAANVSMPIEQYQAYAFAAQSAGLESESFGDVIKDLNAKITDLKTSGGGALADFFAITGQSVEEWHQLQPAEQFERFTTEIEKMSDSDARFWLDEINDSASQMFSTLIGNKGEFKANAQLARDLGLVMSQDVVSGVQSTYSEINTLKALLGGAWQQTVAAAAPAIRFVSTGLREWVVETAQAEGGFARLGKTIATSILTSIETGISGVSQLFYQIQSASYILMGEHNRTYIEMQRNLRNLTAQQNAYQQSVDKHRANYQATLQLIQDHENGIKRLSAAELQQSRAAIATHEQNVQALGATGDELLNLEQQVRDFEQQQGISAPFSGAIGTISQLKNQINNIKTELTELNNIPPPNLTPPTNNLTVVENPYASQIKQAEEYFALKRLMRQNDWTQERAQLQLQIDEYNAAHEQKLLSEREFRMLKSQVTAEYDAQALEQNQTFLQQLQSQVEQTTQNYQSMWGQTFDRFTQGVGQSVANALMTQQSFSDSMKNVLRGVVKSTIAALAEMAAKRIALWATEKLLNKATATGAAGLLTTQAQAMSFMAGLNAFASTAAIPIIGPPAAPAAMGAALAVTQPMAGAIAGLGAGMVGMAHSGIDYVPREGTWLLDKGERVYTNENANQLDRMSQSLSVLAANQTAQKPAPTFHIQLNNSALGADAQTYFAENIDDITRAIQARMPYV